MTDSQSLINIGELAKPATVLIEKIAGAVGVLYEPRRIKKRAEAEAVARRILALSEIEATDLIERADRRRQIQDARNQQNIETITADAVRQLPESANPSDMDEDWIAHFFKRCETVSDAQMQSLWARLLAGEATAPGTFSRRTVDLVESLEKDDAELFTRFCQFVWKLNDLMPIIYGLDNPLFAAAGFRYPEIRVLEEAGLITFNNLTGYQRGPFPKRALLHYFGRPVLLEFPNEQANNLSLGCVLLTVSGEQLARISGATPNDGYFDYIISRWTTDGIASSSPLKTFFK